MDSRDSGRSGASEAAAFLADQGVGHLFGLPGSSMVALLHELQSVPVEYVPAVHESIAVAMADGYARVRGLGCASVYMMPGLANSIGNLYNAWRDESPLLLLASQQLSRARDGQAAVGESDMVEMVRPFTRLAAEIPSGAPLRSRLAAAVRAALGPPSGPAFLSIPLDVYEESASTRPERRSHRAVAGPPDVSEVARALARAERPLLVVGGQLLRHGGGAAVAALAERLAIPIAYEAGWNDRLAVGPGHPNAIGRLVDSVPVRVQAEADVVITVGARHVLDAHPRPEPWYPTATFVAHVNADVNKVEFPRTADWACACDPARFVAALDAALSGCAYEAGLPQRQARLAAIRANIAVLAPSAYSAGVAALRDALERGWLVDESVTASGHLIRALTSVDGSRYVSTTGASLGWGIGAACGVAVASGEPVTCVLGDGGLLFGIQGLWTAVARELPITFVVFDNNGYGSTRLFEQQYHAKLGDQARHSVGYLGSDFRGLGPDPADVLAGFGVSTTTVAEGADARSAILLAWEASRKGPNAVVIRIPFG